MENGPVWREKNRAEVGGSSGNPAVAVFKFVAGILPIQTKSVRANWSNLSTRIQVWIRSSRTHERSGEGWVFRWTRKFRPKQSSGMRAEILQAQAKLDATSSKESSRNVQEWIQKLKTCRRLEVIRSSPRIKHDSPLEKAEPGPAGNFPGRKLSKFNSNQFRISQRFKTSMC